MVKVSSTYPLNVLAWLGFDLEGLQCDVAKVLLVVVPGELITVVQQELSSHDVNKFTHTEVFWGEILLHFLG